MGWRLDGWENPHEDKVKTILSRGGHRGSISTEKLERQSGIFEAGADALGAAYLPLLKQVYAQLCGVRLKEGETDYYSALDDSIDRLKAILEVDKE